MDTAGSSQLASWLLPQRTAARDDKKLAPGLASGVREKV
jgi:hypothetical protein